MFEAVLVSIQVLMILAVLIETLVVICSMRKTQKEEPTPMLPSSRQRRVIHRDESLVLEGAHSDSVVNTDSEVTA